MIAYIKKLPTLTKGVLKAFYNYFNFNDRFDDGVAVKGKSSNLNKHTYFAQPTPPAINAQRAAYWSGSSKIYRG